ncbi:LPS export ABC transporter permease LptF [Candidatus Sororendozoicomonas aggregata]|uniref:LPS export ABC transporter permease LptF n=1 Tax=Candidatus Sororendozoicomonas aggregata TaxID=3073239 RepID=UPI002ED69F2E
MFFVRLVIDFHFFSDGADRMPLIIFKYLLRQTIQVMLAVSSVVVLILMSGRFVNYLSQAASGTLRADFLLAIMAYRMPEFLVMILPLGLLLGIILGYGRMYVDQEMSVLNACGISQNQLLTMTMIPGLLVMVVLAVLSFFVVPVGIQKVERILATQDSLTEFDTLVPGRFQLLGNGERATYTESLSNDKQTMNNVFIAQRSSEQGLSGGITLVLADHARMTKREEGVRYLMLHDGVRYDMTPGSLETRVIDYATYGLLMPESQVKEDISEEKALPTSVLLSSHKPGHIAELQWRLSLPLSIPIVILLGIPMARVNPRQGRYAKLLPTMLIYLFYIMLLITFRGAIGDGQLPPWPGMWWVNAAFLVLAVSLYCYEPVKLSLARRRAAGA